jgi:short subunit fatty acids transporter
MGDLIQMIIEIIRNLLKNDLPGTIVVAILIVGYYYLSRMLIRKIFHSQANTKINDIDETESKSSTIDKKADYYYDPVKQYNETRNFFILIGEFAVVFVLFIFLASKAGLIQTDFQEIIRNAFPNNR